MSESITTDLFATLDTVVMEQLNDGSFIVIGTVPEWFRQFYPVNSERYGLTPGEKFPFLENFIIDAENFWQRNEAEPLKSGLWVEADISGKEFYLEASAVKLKNKRILLISLGEIATFKDKQLLIQKGRENSLNYYKLLKETQEKEVLIHCIIHDLADPLTGINYCFELLALQQNLSPKGKEYLENGKKQAKKQERLIREILDAFSAEVEALDNFTLNITQAPDALICAKEVINTLSPTFSLNQINLQLSPDIETLADWKVVGEKLRLDRVLSNLVENAFRHSLAGSTVTIDLKQDRDFIITIVKDQGFGVSPDIASNLFQKFSQGKERPGKIGLGLYFCRITVERWGGTIGYLPLDSGGSQFWFRLPKPS